MQTVISQIAFTFVDDAMALATGAVRLVRSLTVDMLAAVRAKLTGPLERLAAACDVAGILAARRAAAVQSVRPSRLRSRFDIFGIASAFRTLRDLT